MNNDLIVAIISALGGATITGFFSFISQKNTNKKDIEIMEREAIMADQQALRREMREEIHLMKEEILKWKEINLRLEEELFEWKEKYILLEAEYAQAKNKIAYLEQRVEGLSKDA